MKAKPEIPEAIPEVEENIPETEDNVFAEISDNQGKQEKQNSERKDSITEKKSSPPYARESSQI